MKFNIVSEARNQPKLVVVFSEEIADKIEDIDFHNRNNVEAISEFHYFIDCMISYVSNPVIAWNNQGRYRQTQEGYTRISELGYDITFIIKTNDKTQQSYIFIVEAKLVPDGLKLNLPYYITENNNTKLRSIKKSLIRLTEDDLCHIVKNCINEVLLVENRENKSKPPRFMLNNTPNYIS